MALDRDAIIRQAEKLLRQGRLEGAIAEYVRLTHEQPRDWTLGNTLGDLYIRSGDTERAVVQFMRAADALLADGFIPKASALYKKTLKIAPRHEEALLRLSEAAARQGLLADARTHLRTLAKLRHDRHDARGVAECTVRLALLDDADTFARLAGARAAHALGDIVQATALFRSAADDLTGAGEQAAAIDVLVEATTLDPSNRDLGRFLVRTCLASGEHLKVQSLLTSEIAGDDPELLLALARNELGADREDNARAALTRLIAVAADRARDVAGLADELARSGQMDRAFTCADVVADAALLAHDSPRAIDVLQRLVENRPHIPALMKLVELAVDTGRDDLMLQTQEQLADAYLAAGQGAQARIIAEDLVARDPGSKVHADRLRRALVMLGVADPDLVITRTRIDMPMSSHVTALDAPQTEDTGERGGAAAADEPIVFEVVEIDLNDALAALDALSSEPGVAAPAPPRDLDDVFAEIRTRVARDVPASIGRLERERKA